MSNIRVLKNKLFILPALVALVILLTWCLPQIHFNWRYHNDEPSKVGQVLSGKWNLRHPPLLLEIVTGIGHWTQQATPQQVVECGRAVSVAAVGIALMAAMGMVSLRGGIIAVVGMGVILLLQPELFEIAHYFKEDALFIAGVMLVFYGLLYSEQSFRRWPEYGVAIGLALCMSAKYEGWSLLPLVAWFLWLNRSKYGMGLLAFYCRWLAVWLIVLILCYLPILLHWQGFRAAFADEMRRLEFGEYGLPVAGAMWRNYWTLLRVTVPAVFLWGYGIYWLYGLLAYRRTAKADWFLLAAPLLGLGLLAATAKYSERYLLPVNMLLLITGFCGPLMIINRLLARWPAWRHLTVWLCCAALTYIAVRHSLPTWRQVYQGFQHDSRAELVEWIQQNLPASAVIAEDAYAKISQQDLPQQVWSPTFFVADLGTLDSLQDMGVTHLIISYDVYHRFVDGSSKPSPAQVADFKRRQQFYRTARSQLKVLWQDANANPKALHPGLSLIELPRRETAP